MTELNPLAAVEKVVSFLKETGQSKYAAEIEDAIAISTIPSEILLSVKKKIQEIDKTINDDELKKFTSECIISIDQSLRKSNFWPIKFTS